MLVRKVLSAILVFGIISMGAAAFAADGSVFPDTAADSLSPDSASMDEAEPVVAAAQETETPVPDSPAPGGPAEETPSYIFVRPAVPAIGMNVAQFLQEKAAQIPDAWVGSAAGERVAEDALVCTGMRLMNTDGEKTEVSAVIIVWGDVLGLGKLNLRQLIREALLLQSHDDIAEHIRMAGDVNQNGKIDVTDLCALAAALPAGTIPPGAEKVTADMRAVDILAYIPEDLYPAKRAGKWDYSPVLSNRQITLSLPGRYSTWLNAAADSLHYENIARIEKNFTAPGWPLIASVVTSYRGDPNGMRAALADAVRITTATRYEGEDLILTVTAAPVNPSHLFYSRPVSAVTNVFLLTTTYAYLSTLYDDSMTATRGIGLPRLEALYFPIAQPSRYYVGDCWLAARDSGARKHTGTDVNAPRGTNLLACVTGTIIGNGYDPVAGNYVVLLGNDGTQYHYYHLVQLSEVPVGTRVRRGDVVGHVGSTGNSRANHLHFTIVTAGGQYVNSYPYLLRAQEATVNGTVRPA